MATLQFLTGGDVVPMRDSGAGMFGDLASQFQQADISFVNLECALSDKGERARGKPIAFRGTPASVDGLLEAGLTCVNLANNHVLDYGDAALFDTLDLLDKKSIGRFGAGRNLDEARQSCIVEKSGLRIGFLGYTTTLPVGFAATPSSPGVNPIQVNTDYEPTVNLSEYPGVAPRIVTWSDPDHLNQLRDDVRALGPQADIIIVYAHWGASLSPHVHDFQREIGKTAIDAGAHAVFGGHNHVLSAIEFYEGRPIVYCSGNLLFDERVPFFTDETRKTCLFGATLARDGLQDCYLLPAKTGVGAPPELFRRNDPLWQEIFSGMQMRCRDFGTQLAARDDAIEVRAG